MSALARTLRRIGAVIDDALPMSADERKSRDPRPPHDARDAERNRLRFRLGMLGRRGKGGFR